ncbi:MAG: hypothetical protein JWN24_462 [Phycisphaerales bacterium]|nr:hypothetical protein [Phycisphaerales bacterium]
MRKQLVAAILSAAVTGIGLTTFSPAYGQVRPPAAQADKAAAGQQQVPVKVVVLFTSGVGYFEHFGTITGDSSTELHFKTEQINDILKSLLLEDMDKGKVAAVTYGSQEPLSHALKSFQVDLSSSPALPQLLSQLRGAVVTATLAQGQVTGQVLGVEKKQKPAGDKQVVDVWTLNLLLGGGTIRPVELEQVTEVKLDDPKLQQELVKALAAVAAARDQDRKPVSIRFTGQGERRVRIGYVVEAPVWKASYRLVLTEDAKNEAPEGKKDGGGKDRDAETRGRGDAEKEDGGKNQGADNVAGDAKGKGGRLQGWAIVENQTDSDWESVELSLVSGRPISFIENLYQPLYVPRPLVEPQLFASLRPQTYSGGMEMAKKLEEAVRDEDEKAAEAKDGALGGRMLRRQAGLAAGAAPAAAGAQMQQLAQPINPMASVSAMASGAKVGELFQYTVPDVRLPRQKSAMIPILTDPVAAARLSIYNQGVLATNPLLGVRLTNTTGKLLPQGPITVLDAGAYAGDAQVEDLPAGQNRLLSYGIDQQVIVHADDHTENSSLVTGKIVKGVLELTYKQTFTQDYVAQNKAKNDKTLLVEHPKRPGWNLIQPAKPLETTDALYRFEELLPGGATAKMTVKEELVSSQGIAILPMDVGQVEAYLRTGEIPKPVKDALQAAAKLKYAVVDTERQMQERQQKVNEISQEQARIRENMKTVAQSSDYYQRLLKKLDEQESQIEKLQAELKDLQKKRDQQRKELEDSLLNLNVG